MWTQAALASPLVMDNAWSRATVPGATSAAVYGTLVNTGEQTLVIDRIETDIAEVGQMHETVLEADMMRMKHRHHFSVAAGQAIELSPGKLHIMLMGVKKNLVAGETFVIRIVADSGESLDVTVKIGQMGQMTAP